METPMPNEPSPKPSKHAPPEFVHLVKRGYKRDHLAREFAARGYKKGAEIGVADGRFAEVICQRNPGVKLFAIDPWMPYKGNRRGGGKEQHARNYALAQQRLQPYGVRIVRKMSEQAALDFPLASLDFVFIDGNHDRAYVERDLALWAPRVKTGGIVAGHDFYHFQNSGVVEAVVAYTSVNGITDWHVCDEREPSFWWLVS
jgi:hypothetical protein